MPLLGLKPPQDLAGREVEVNDFGLTHRERDRFTVRSDRELANSVDRLLIENNKGLDTVGRLVPSQGPPRSEVLFVLVVIVTLVRLETEQRHGLLLLHVPDAHHA